MTKMTQRLPPPHQAAVAQDNQYRAKLKVREVSLAAHVSRLRTDIRHLRLLRDLARSLRRCGGRAPSLAAHTEIVTTVASALHGARNRNDMRDDPHDHQQHQHRQQFQLHRTAVLNHQGTVSTDSTRKDIRRGAGHPQPISSDSLRRHIDSLIVCGAPSAPIVKLSGSLRGRLSSSTIRQLYQCTPGNSALMHALVGREVVFSSRRVLFFSTDGALERDVSETDYASGLVPIVGGRGYGLSAMVALLSHAERSNVQ